MSLVGALTRGPGVNTALPPPTTPLIRNLPTVTVLSEECSRIMMLYDLKRKWFQRRYSGETARYYISAETISIDRFTPLLRGISIYMYIYIYIYIYMNNTEQGGNTPSFKGPERAMSKTNILYIPYNMGTGVLGLIASITAVVNGLILIIYPCCRVYLLALG